MANQIIVCLLLIITPIMQLPALPTICLTIAKWGISFLLVFLWIRFRLTNKESLFPELPINLFIYFFLGIAFISTIFSLSFKISFELLVEYVGNFLILFIFFDFINSKKYIKQLILLLLVLGTLEGVYALVEFIIVFKPDIRLMVARYRSCATLIHPNLLAMYLSMILPIAVGLFFFVKKLPYRILLAFSILSMLGGLLCANSRGGIINVGVAFGCIGLIKYRKLLVMLTLVACIALIVYLSYADIIRMYLRMDNKLSDREYAWSYGVEILKERPLFGFGLGTQWMPYSQKFYSDRGWLVKPQPDAHGLVWDAHNTYLNHAIEMGILAPFCLLWFLFIYFKEAIRLIKSLPESYWQVLVIAFFSICAGSFVQSLFESLSMFGCAGITTQFMLVIALTFKISEMNANKELLV